MPYKTETTGGNFKQRVDGVVRAGKSIRANIQELCHFAFVAYLDPKNSGNTADLSYLLLRVTEVKSLNASRLAMYMEDTVNVKVGKTKDGEPVVRKAVKGDAPSLREGSDLTAPWWEHGRAPANNDVDILADIERLIRKIEGTQGDEPKKSLKSGQQPAVDHVLTALMGARARAEADINRAELEAAAVASVSVAA